MVTQTIAERIERVRLLIAGACARSGRPPDDVTIVAITKGFGADVIGEAAAIGIRDFGENRVQEGEAKRPQLSDLHGVVWHMVGHLQTNKVSAVLRLFDIIHSVDSVHLAEAISRRALRPVPVFLEVNVAAEATKSGFSLEDTPKANELIATMPNIEVQGLMTVAPIAPTAEDIRPVFQRLREEAHALGLRELSMGMSDDFEVAVEEGATHVRIGRAIFGERK